MTRCQSDMIGIKADGRITSIYFSCRAWQLSLKYARDTLTDLCIRSLVFSRFWHPFREKSSPLIGIDIVRNRRPLLLERIDRIPPTIDRSIDYASERVKLPERPFNSGKWLDRNNGAIQPIVATCSIIADHWSRWPIYINRRLVFRAISLDSELSARDIFFDRIVRASSISSERKSCSGHDTRYLPANKRKRRGLPRIINGAYRRKLGWKIEPVLMMRLLGFPFSSDGEKLSVDDSFRRERQKEDSKQDSNDTRRSLIAW